MSEGGGRPQRARNDGASGEGGRKGSGGDFQTEAVHEEVRAKEGPGRMEGDSRLPVGEEEGDVGIGKGDPADGGGGGDPPGADSRNPAGEEGPEIVAGIARDGLDAPPRDRQPVDLHHPVEEGEGFETGLETLDRQKGRHGGLPPLRALLPGHDGGTGEGAGDGEPRHHNDPAKPVDGEPVEPHRTPEGAGEGLLCPEREGPLQKMRPLHAGQGDSRQKESEEAQAAAIQAPGPPAGRPLSFIRTKNILVW